MSKFRKIVYSNKLFCLFIMLIQLGILIGVSFFLTDYSRTLYVVMTIIGTLLIIYEINRDEEPGFKLTWVLLLAVIPIFGALLYLFLHYNFISKKIAERSEEIREDSVKFTKQSKDVIDKLSEKSKEDIGITKYIYDYSGLPVYDRTKIDYFPLGEDMFEELKRDLKAAEKFIFIEIFIINPKGKMWPEILEILKDKAAKGVEVRLLYDNMGCITLLPADYCDTMTEFGINCRVFAPIVPIYSTHQNNRDHRKVIVIDGKTSYTGGVNFADEYINERKRFGHWKDNAIRIRGAAVSSMTAMFLQMWNVADFENNERNDYGKYITLSENSEYDCEGFVAPFADSPLENDRFGENLYINNLNMAQEYVHIMTPYLVLGASMLHALKTAAKRGVDVKLMLPHKPDKPYAFWLAGTYYCELIESGVQIYEYTPGFVHAKMSVSDGKRAVIGTINHDYRSLYLHYENAVYLVDVPEIREMEEDFGKTLRQCQRVTVEDFKKRSIITRTAGRLIRLVAPLL